MLLIMDLRRVTPRDEETVSDEEGGDHAFRAHLNKGVSEGLA